MKCFSVVANGAPIPLFAHKYDTSEKSWELSTISGLWEISYVREGHLLIEYPDETISVPAGSIVCSNHGVPTRICNQSDHHVHYTVGFFLPRTPQNSSFSGKEILIPQVFKPENEAYFYSRFKQIIYALPKSKLRCSAFVMLLLCDIADQSFEEASNINPLCSKAKKYIQDHLTEKITPPQIASAINVSYGHLSRVFKEQEQKTLLEYTTEQRLQKICEMLLYSKITLEKAGEKVGLCDVKYVSRLFKKVYNMTAKELIKSLHTNESEMLYNVISNQNATSHDK